MKRALIFAIASVAACTYGPEQDHVNVQNVALAPDGSRVAVIVKYERHRPATGLTAFPDGGVPRVLIQRADLYVVDLRSRTLVYGGELPAPADHRVSFNPWLIGWDGDMLYFTVIGCPGSPGDECYGPLVQRSVFTLSPAGRIAPGSVSAIPVLTTSRRHASEYLDVGAEPYGVSIGTRLGAARSPLMRFVGVRLEVVRGAGQRRSKAASALVG